MRKLILPLILPLILGLSLCVPAHAQKSKIQINSEIDTFFADNNSGAITPSKLRTVTKDIVASYVDWLTCMGTGGLVYWNSGAPTCLPPGSSGQVITMTGGMPMWAAPSPAAAIVVGSTSISGGSPGIVLYDNSGVLGGYAVSGTGSVAMTVNPVFTTPNLGTPSAVTLTNGTGLPAPGLTGTLQAAQFPALTGDVTTTAGSLSTTIGAGKVTNSMLAGSIAASKLVGTDISTVGTVTTGTWQASVVGVSYGGTGGGTPSGTLLDNITGFSGTGFLTRTGAGTYAFQSLNNGITNSNLAQAGAATFKGNPTGSTASVSDFTIQGLTARGTPDAANDKLPIYDNAAGTIKYVTPAQIAGSSSGTVTSITAGTGLTGGTITTSGTIAVDKATTSDYYAGTSNKVPTTDVIYPPEETITYGTTTTFNFGAFINAKVTLTGNITTMTFNNIVAGKAGSIRFIQDGTGSRTTVWNSNLKWGGGSAPVLSTAANAVDVLNYNCITISFCQATLVKDVK